MDHHEPWQIRQAPLDSTEGFELMAELWAEIDALYGNEIATAAEFQHTDAGEIVFVIARQHDNAVGCGAIRPRTAAIAEVKRVFVRPAVRRSGAARAIMHTLEQLARERGFSEIWLETGLRQPGALALYESLGYTRIGAFGDYKDDPLSVCLGKQLK